jgi:hypothetical protein
VSPKVNRILERCESFFLIKQGDKLRGKDKHNNKNSHEEKSFYESYTD